MKLLTLNTHSIIEENYKKKLEAFVEMILIERPDVFALQEVNQTLGKVIVNNAEDIGYVPCKRSEATILCDNHALRVAEMLKEAGLQYEWTWIPLKIGYSKYEEGLALFSLKPLQETKAFYISDCQSMGNWKTRKALGIKVDDIWFYSIHMGWWHDKEEPFKKQWEKLQKNLGLPSEMKELCFVMGDFNSQAELRGEGYDMVAASGWQDTWRLADKKDKGFTVEKQIDGWTEQDTQAMRIDYIWSNKKIKVASSGVVFNGKNYPIVSDHYGVKIEVLL